MPLIAIDGVTSHRIHIMKKKPRLISTIAGGHGNSYFSHSSRSRLPAFTPIRMGMPLSFALRITCAVLRSSPS